MRRTHLVSASVVLAAAALGGCQQTEWNWWQWQPRGSASAPDSAAAAPLAPESASSLRAENDALREQLEEFRARDERLAGKVSELQFLCDQQTRDIDVLKEAAAERDKARLEAAALREQFELLQSEVRLLRGGAGAPASQPAESAPPAASTPPAPTTAPAPVAPSPD